MEKIWIKNYQEGVPTEVDLTPYTSIDDMLRKICVKYAHQPAFSQLDTKMSYKKLDENVSAFAAYLQKTLQLKKGERVAMMLPNILQYPIVFFGILRAGMIAVTINPYYTAHEVTTMLNDCDAQTIVFVNSVAPVLQKCITNTKIKHMIMTYPSELLSFFKAGFIRMKEKKYSQTFWDFMRQVIPFKTVLQQGKKQHFEQIALDLQDPALLEYTGGTTGTPKGAILTHKNILANALQISSWILPALVGQKNPVVITSMPLYHIFALTVNCMTFILLGGLNVLISNPRDTSLLIKQLKKIKCTVFPGINTLFNHLLNDPSFSTINFSHLKLTIAGGMPLQQLVAQRWKKITGCSILNAYGLTEASGAVAFNRTDIDTYTGSVGLPLASTDISIRDEADHEQDIDESGELCVKGPQLMQGYWERPEETKQAFTPDGFLKTGDMAIVDSNGYLFIVDRKKDLIIVSGFKVYPHEIEEVIAKYPGVAEVAVIGEPSEKTGEAVKAFIVKKDPHLTAQEINDHCKNELAPYKIPKNIQFIEEIPKTRVGKVLKNILRQMH